MSTFEIRDQFYLDGQPFKIISGGIHYFRVVPEYWRDRLEKLKAMGCNTVETYVCWNMHEPQPGQFNFEGMFDIKKFIETAGDLGLKVIVRPGPFICAEWEFGGLPGWLLRHDNIKLRGRYEPYMTYVRNYFTELFKILAPLQITQGGPIILFQIENEYGYYNDDREYLLEMGRMMRDLGAEVPFVTSDGPWDDALDCGKCDMALPTANFGSHVEEQFGVLAQHTNGGPLMCMEFWVGWFDNWGCGKHSTSNLYNNQRDFDDALRMGNINIYMFHGGTNFGFTNGSNYYDELSPDVTSYDYDAVLTEWGDITPKYEAFKAIVAKYAPVPEVEFTTKIEKGAYGTLECEARVSLNSVLEDISTPIEAPDPMCMEKLGQNFGYTLYRTSFPKGKTIGKLAFAKVSDRAIVFMEGKRFGTYYDRELLKEYDFKRSPYVYENDGDFDVLTENMGRVNFSYKIEYQRKGIEDGVLINGHYHTGWKMYPLPLDNIDKIDFDKPYYRDTAAFYKFSFQSFKSMDTFLDLEGFGKGCAFINGFNLGRFWDIGPQKRLYIPAPLIKNGRNEIVIFETEGRNARTIKLVAEPDLGPLELPYGRPE